VIGREVKVVRVGLSLNVINKVVLMMQGSDSTASPPLAPASPRRPTASPRRLDGEAQVESESKRWKRSSSIYNVKR
jgi:hypothetical protein